MATLSNDVTQEIERLIEKSGAYYGAIDFILQDDQIYFLELNVVPGIEQLEKISGQNVLRPFLSAKFFCQIL